MAKNTRYQTHEEQKADFQRSGLVKPPGGKVDAIHWRCEVCNSIVFWRLLSLIDAGKYRCVWCDKKEEK